MLFTHEHRELQHSLGRFIADEVNPHVDEWEAAGIFPAHELFKKLGTLGFLGLTKPEAYGGAGLGSIGGGADEIMLSIICKYMGTLPKRM